MKKVIIVLLVLGAVVGSVPLWGSCDLKADVCSSWCRIKHLNSDAKTLGCRTSCSIDQASCRSEEAVGGFNEFLEGLKGK